MSTCVVVQIQQVVESRLGILHSSFRLLVCTADLFVYLCRVGLVMEDKLRGPRSSEG